MIKKHLTDFKIKFLKMNSTALNDKILLPNFITDYNSKEKIQYVSSEYEQKLSTFCKSPEKLIIVTDFDFTLTKKYHKDNNLYSSYCVLEYSNGVSEDYKKLNKELFSKYSKIENDFSIDFETRDKLIHQWFKENLDLLLAEKIYKEDFYGMLIQAERNFYYRYGILEFFSLIEKNNIPLFIISGGISEIIEESLKVVVPEYQSLKEKNLIHIVANQFEYDTNNKVVGYKSPFVYTFNKGETLKNIFKEFNTGDANIIVMGDHLNDTDTVKHIDYNEEIKIGFINYFEDSLTEQHHKMIEAYKLKYDVCLINDGNLTFINSLMKNIINKKI
jgi:HAD superfamily hydrolase (TIGR01544 family)